MTSLPEAGSGRRYLRTSLAALAHLVVGDSVEITLGTVATVALTWLVGRYSGFGAVALPVAVICLAGAALWRSVSNRSVRSKRPGPRPAQPSAAEQRPAG
jgi:hypothetical protein